MCTKNDRTKKFSVSEFERSIIIILNLQLKRREERREKREERREERREEKERKREKQP